MKVPEKQKETKKKEMLKNLKRNANLRYLCRYYFYLQNFLSAFCNFVFPNELDEEEEIMIQRPMPRDGATIEDAISPKKKKNSENKESENQTAVTEDVFDAIPIEQQLQNIDGLNQREDIKILKRLEKQTTDTSYRDRIQKSLELLFKNRRKYLSPKSISYL